MAVERRNKSSKIRQFLKIGVPTPVLPVAELPIEAIPWNCYLDVAKYIPITLWTDLNSPVLVTGVIIYQNSNLLVRHNIPTLENGFFVYGENAYETVNGIIKNVTSLENYF